MLHRCFIVLACFVLFFSGCTTIPSEKTEMQIVTAERLWQTRLQQLQSITTFAIKGRMALQTSNEAWSASVHWAQKEQRYTIRIIAPLGRGTYEITGDTAQVSLLTAEKQVYEADTPETLMQETLGWSVPVDGMQFWILGIPVPGQPFENLQLDLQGRMKTLHQAGWSVAISRYKQYQQYELPAKIIMENPPLKLKLIIKDWGSVL